MKLKRFDVLVVGAAWLLCSGSSCGDGATGTDSGSADSGSTEADAGPYPDQPKCKAVPAFHIGLSQTGEMGLVKASVEEAKPTPPQMFENDWVVKLTDPDGKPIAGLDLYKVQPYMPEHGHDGTFDPGISKGDGDGVFKVAAINMWMKDVWEVRLFVHVDATHDDKIVFNVCIPP